MDRTVLKMLIKPLYFESFISFRASSKNIFMEFTVLKMFDRTYQTLYFKISSNNN